MFFSNAQREGVKADNPGIAFGDVGKILGQRWKELSAEDKVPYEAQAAEDKQRYEEQMRAYKAAGAGGGGDEGAAGDE